MSDSDEEEEIQFLKMRKQKDRLLEVYGSILNSPKYETMFKGARDFFECDELIPNYQEECQDFEKTLLKIKNAIDSKKQKRILKKTSQKDDPVVIEFSDSDGDDWEPVFWKKPRSLLQHRIPKNVFAMSETKTVPMDFNPNVPPPSHIQRQQVQQPTIVLCPYPIISNWGYAQTAPTLNYYPPYQAEPQPSTSGYQSSICQKVKRNPSESDFPHNQQTNRMASNGYRPTRMDERENYGAGTYKEHREKKEREFIRNKRRREELDHNSSTSTHHRRNAIEARKIENQTPKKTSLNDKQGEDFSRNLSHKKADSSNQTKTNSLNPSAKRSTVAAISQMKKSAQPSEEIQSPAYSPVKLSTQTALKSNLDKRTSALPSTTTSFIKLSHNKTTQEAISNSESASLSKISEPTNSNEPSNLKFTNFIPLEVTTESSKQLPSSSLIAPDLCQPTNSESTDLIPADKIKKENEEFGDEIVENWAVKQLEIKTECETDSNPNTNASTEDESDTADIANINDFNCQGENEADVQATIKSEIEPEDENAEDILAQNQQMMRLRELHELGALQEINSSEPPENVRDSRSEFNVPYRTFNNEPSFSDPSDDESNEIIPYSPFRNAPKNGTSYSTSTDKNELSVKKSLF